MQKPPQAANIEESGNEESDEESSVKLIIDDGRLLLFSIAPLCFQTKMSGDILWRNPTPNSPRFCRPLKFFFTSESDDVVLREMAKLDREINDLEEIVLEISSVPVKCTFSLHCTMLDVKVINTLTGTKSTKRCYLCQCTPTEVNNLTLPKQGNIVEDHLKYGLTTLHGWVKMMEYILKISYMLKFKKSSVVKLNADEKEQMDRRRDEIKERLREEIGVVIDRFIPGRGSSNTGNVARKFFRHHATVSRITEVDHECIQRLYHIMILLTGTRKINLENFTAYTKATAEKFVSLYPWCYMPVSVHKLLVHSPAVCRQMPLPIGFMSEEASEAANKIYRRSRDAHTRKAERSQTITDVLHYMLAYSDPKLSMLRSPQKSKSHQGVPDEVLFLLESIDSRDDNNNDKMKDQNETEEEEEDNEEEECYEYTMNFDV
jgi:hypothetical protein